MNGNDAGKDAELFSGVSEETLVQMDTAIMALHFYAPIYLMLTVCDREPEREKEALLLMEQHIRQFNKLYGREEPQ